MAITTVDDIASGLNSAQTIQYYKTATNTAKGAGAFLSMWVAGGFPATGATPPAYTAGSGYTCSSATAGAMIYSNGAVQNWLAKVGMMCNQPGVIILADRLWACGGMGFAASTYTITTPGSLPARITDNGIGVEAWIENYTTSGAASGTATFNYTDANTGAASAGVIAAVVSAPQAGQMQPIPMEAGDTGVRAPVSLVTSATWTSGTGFGITLLKRIVEIPIIAANTGFNLDWAQLGLPKIPADACLMAIFLANGAVAPVLMGTLKVIDK
jgi:hypothetical protein